jgi:hypothetical protein
MKTITENLVLELEDKLMCVFADTKETALFFGQLKGFYALEVRRYNHEKKEFEAPTYAICDELRLPIMKQAGWKIIPVNRRV